MKLTDGRTLKKHIDHIRKRTVTVEEPVVDAFDDIGLPLSPDNTSSPPSATTSSEVPLPLRRSTRIRNPPTRYPDLVS